MAELRWMILLFGALFVVGVYLAMRRQNRRRASGGGERQEPLLGGGGALDDGPGDPWGELRREPDLSDLDLDDDAVAASAPLPPEQLIAETEAPAYLRRQRGDATPVTDATVAPPAGLPVVEVGEQVEQLSDGERALPPRARRPAEQLELSVPHTDGHDESDAADDIVEPDLEEVFTLRLVPRSGTGSFQGDAVGQGLLTAGLAQGRFDIFHYVPPGSDQSVFSVANLVEPGTLREEDLAGQQVPGLTLFMLLPGPLPGARALEEMITCARLLANYLDATVQDDTGGSLTRQTEEHLKERVVDFEHRRARAEH